MVVKDHETGQDLREGLMHSPGTKNLSPPIPKYEEIFSQFVTERGYRDAFLELLNFGHLKTKVS